jgi:uncharacterized protein (TIGR00290 family)
MDQVFVNWSGGKDAALSLYRLLGSGTRKVGTLVTTVTAPVGRVSMHGVREGLLRAQASSLGIPLRVVYLPEHCSLETYDARMASEMNFLRAEGYTGAVFGDIFLEDLRRYREQRLESLGLQGVFPLWKEESPGVARAFIRAGFRAVVCCVNAAVLDERFAGREYDESFLKDLPPGVDPAGERGEFHTFVYDGPLFRHPVAYLRGEVVEKSYPPSGKSGGWDSRFFFCDLLPADR